MSQDVDYDVGYRKPPKSSRWRKGQSGNRSGRQKGVRNLKTELTEELGEIINIKEQGLARTVGDRYMPHDGGTENAGYIMAGLMRHLRYVEDGQGKMPDGCVAKTAMKWKPSPR